MRDPNRIPEILKTFEEVWRLHSDWRFMQLICNIQAAHGSDMFFIEDDQLVDIIKELTKPEPVKKRKRKNNGSH